MEQQVRNKQSEFEEYGYLLDSDDWKKELPGATAFKSDVITENPKVSVIIANFNNEPYLKRMMDSLVNQSIGIENLQILFVDDRSTDNSLEVVLPYTEKYPNIEIYLLDKNTGGAHGPRNVGLTHARGEYIEILDADDWFAPDGLETLANLLDESSGGIVFGGVVRSQNDEMELTTPAYVEMDAINRDIEDLPYEFFNWMGPQGNMVRHSTVKENNLHFVDQRVADDVTFFYQIMRLSKTISQTTKLTTYLNRDDDNASLSKSVNETFLTSWMRALSYLKNNYPMDSTMQRFMSRRLEWLILDFGLRWDTAYGMSLESLEKFKALIDEYLGDLSFNPTDYFDAEPQKIVWNYLMAKDFTSLLRFVEWNSLDSADKRTMKKDDLYYYVPDDKDLPEIQIPVVIKGKNVDIVDDNLQINFDLYTKEKFNRVEIRNYEQPFNRFELPVEKLSNTQYCAVLSQEDYKKLGGGINKFYVILNDYDEHMISIGDTQQFSAPENVFVDFRGVMAVNKVAGNYLVTRDFADFRAGQVVDFNSSFDSEGRMKISGLSFKSFKKSTLKLPDSLSEMSIKDAEAFFNFTPAVYKADKSIVVYDNPIAVDNGDIDWEIKKDALFMIYNVSLTPKGQVIFWVGNGFIIADPSSCQLVESEKVIVKKKVYEYSQKDFKPEYRKSLLPVGSVVNVVGLAFSDNDTPRFKLENGNFITENPSFVELEKNFVLGGGSISKPNNQASLMKKVLRKLSK